MEWTARAQDVLVVGYARESLLERLDAGGCSVTCVILSDSSLDEARVFCPVVHGAPAEQASFASLLNGSRYDAIVLDGALDLSHHPAELLADGRLLLRKGGMLVALFSRAAAFHELFDEAGYRVECFDRLNDAQSSMRFAVLAKPVVTEVVDRTLELRSRLEASAGETERLQSLNVAANARIKELEREALRERITLRGLRSDLDAEKIARSSLEKLLDDRAQVLAHVRKNAAQSEAALYDLSSEAEMLRARIDELERAVASARSEAQKHSDRADRMTAAEAATNAWAESLQQKIADLFATIEWQTASEREVHDQLTREVELRERLTQEHAQERDSLTQERDGLTRERDYLRSSVSETERRLGEEIRELRSRVAEAELALASQTDAIIDSMRAESSKLSALIDTVQSSRFWQFKRWLNRLRARAFGF